jgi:hypothetical protein
MEHGTGASPRQLPTITGGPSLLNVPEVSTFRLYLLRAMYVFMFVGLAIVKWPAILNPPPGLSYADSVVGSVLGAISLLALLGVRYPIKMLPLLFFEFLWKFIWVVGWGLPPVFAEQLTPEVEQTLISCLVGVILVPLVMPWGYVFKRYAQAPGDPWGKQVRVSSSTQPAASPSQA